MVTPGTTVHGHCGKLFYEGDTLIRFIYEKPRSGDITQGLPKVEWVLEVCLIDSISMNLEKSRQPHRIESSKEIFVRQLVDRFLQPIDHYIADRCIHNSSHR